MGIAVIMTSLWLDRSRDRQDSTAEASNAEVAVVGAGAVLEGPTSRSLSR